jgi:hypothetical protein
MDREYFCSACRKPTTPRLCEPGVCADCHFESPLMVRDEERPANYYPDVQAWEYPLRPLTEAERDDLLEELWKEQDANTTQGQRARSRIANGS